MAGRFDAVELWRLRIPLQRPYKLAFGAVEAYDTLIVRLRASDDGIGAGEATLLTGYTDETIGEAWTRGCELADELVAVDRAGYASRIESIGIAAPFLATAFRTALEALERHPLLAAVTPVRVPLVGILNETESAALDAEIDRQLASGYSTLKVKVGFEVSADLDRIARIRRRVDRRARLRLDANQGYAAGDARRFVAALDGDDIELFEQPCAADDWDAHMEVVATARVPLMLDESIYGVADIERAARLGAARFIKLKLMKMAGLEALVEGIAKIRALGMRPVLGNGVACDLGCWMEACVAARHLDNAGEMNGFLKPAQGLLARPLRFEAGAIVLDADGSAELDETRLVHFRVARHLARRSPVSGATR